MTKTERSSQFSQQPTGTALLRGTAFCIQDSFVGGNNDEVYYVWKFYLLDFVAPSQTVCTIDVYNFGRREKNRPRYRAF